MRRIYKKKRDSQIITNFWCFCCGFMVAMIIAVILINM